MHIIDRRLTLGHEFGPSSALVDRSKSVRTTVAVIYKNDLKAAADFDGHTVSNDKNQN